MMNNVRWECYPVVLGHEHAKAWLQIQANNQLSRNTVDAYGRGLQDYILFIKGRGISPEVATREHVSLWVNDLSSRPNKRAIALGEGRETTRLSNATIQQRLTSVRLFYDYLLEEEVCVKNPVGRGRFSRDQPYLLKGQRGFLRSYKKLPPIPTDEEWQLILGAFKGETIRNRAMLALQYDCGLRREELCKLEARDIDPAYRTLRVRAETSKSRKERVVVYSETTGILLRQYLEERRRLTRERGALFRSESRRNLGQPITIWTWSKVIRKIALVSKVEIFTTHTMRHLRLTDAARSGWDIQMIATFAGHRSLDSSQDYIHLSGRDFEAKFGASMSSVHEFRITMIKESLV